MTDQSLPAAEQLTEEQERVRNLFLQNAVRAGARVQMPDGVVVQKKRLDLEPVEVGRATRIPEVEPEDEREVIDLEIEDIDSKVIYLKFTRDGRKVEEPLEIPAPHMNVAFMAGRLQYQLDTKYRKMQRTKDRVEAGRLNREVIALNTELVQLLVPTLTDEILDRLNLRALTEIVNIAQGMVEAAASTQNSSQAVVRRAYRLSGRPYGDTERGLAKWVTEQFADIEEDPDREDDDPND